MTEKCMECGTPMDEVPLGECMTHRAAAKFNDEAEVTFNLDDGKSVVIQVNGVLCRFVRRDFGRLNLDGPAQSIAFQAGVRGYTAGSRGEDVFEASFWPMYATLPSWENY